MAAQTPDELFRRGNEKYAAGDFRAAISDFEQAVRTGEWSANLFYDLGNAYDRSEDFGRAILAYERALALEPNHPEAKSNLRLARDQAQSLESVPTGWPRFLGALTENQCTWAAAIFFWVAVGLLLWRSRGGVAILAGIVLVLAIASVAAVWGLRQQLSGRAIVIGSKVEARVATADSAKSILALPAGSEVRILQRRGDWSYAVLPNNERGWIPAPAAELIRL